MVTSHEPVLKAGPQNCMGSQQESRAVARGDGPGRAAGSPVEQVSRSCQAGRHGAGGADPGGQGRTLRGQC